MARPSTNVGKRSIISGHCSWTHIFGATEEEGVHTVRDGARNLFVKKIKFCVITRMNRWSWFLHWWWGRCSTLVNYQTSCLLHCATSCTWERKRRKGKGNGWRSGSMRTRRSIRGTTQNGGRNVHSDCFGHERGLSHHQPSDDENDEKLTRLWWIRHGFRIRRSQNFCALMKEWGSIGRPFQWEAHIGQKGLLKAMALRTTVVRQMIKSGRTNSLDWLFASKKELNNWNQLETTPRRRCLYYNWIKKMQIE